MATPIRILSCSQHTKYHICTHTHTHTHTHRSSQHPAFPAPAVSASLASVSFSECLTGSQALAFSSASLSQGSDSLSFSLEPIQKLKWLPFTHGIEAFFPLSPCISSLPLSINQSVSLPLSVSPFFLAVFHRNPLRYTFTGPIFLSAGFCRSTQKPLLMQNHLVHVYALQQGLWHNSRIFLRSFPLYQSCSEWAICAL